MMQNSDYSEAMMQNRARAIVEALLHLRCPARLLIEASVRRPPRSSVYVATFTGPEPGKQVSRSTGLRDKEAALARAREWEAKARAQRASHLGQKYPNIRVRRSRPGKGPSQATKGSEEDLAVLTQKEVAQLLKISERTVRADEKSAFEKIRNHPTFRRFWREYAANALTEELCVTDDLASVQSRSKHLAKLKSTFDMQVTGLEEASQDPLTPAEVEAVLGLARTPEEEQLLRKVIRHLQGMQNTRKSGMRNTSA